MTAPPFTLARNAFGRLVFTAPGGEPLTGVVPVRAFPLAAPDEGLSLVGPDGHELVWIERLADLPAAQRALIEADLAEREFKPRLLQLLGVSSFSTPSTWHVKTDRGDTHFVLKGEEDIRRIGPGRLLIASAEGVHYLVPDTTQLDRASKRLLDRFL